MNGELERGGGQDRINRPQARARADPSHEPVLVPFGYDSECEEKESDSESRGKRRSF